MSKPASLLSAKFTASLNRYDRLRKKAEFLFLESRLNKFEVENIYAVLYVQSVALFESTLEEIFIGLVSGEFKTKITKVNPKIHIKHPNLARKVLYGVSPYFNWFPYDRNTEKISEIYFEDNANPFALIDGDKKLLEKIIYIRNAIAHNSRHARLTFTRKVTADKLLPLREKREPASFLRSIHTVNQTRYEYYTIEMRRIISNICS